MQGDEMPRTVELTTPLGDADVEQLEIGDEVLLNGVVYTARDAAHARLVGLIDEGKELPFDVKGQAIYYVGPSPAKPGAVIGSAGPTTSYRMDAYAGKLMALGLKAMIGKGSRAQHVIDDMAKYKCVYLAAVGGAAAVLANTVKSREIVAYEELGPEAITKLVVEKFPTVVINDVRSNDLYKAGREQYVR